MAEHDWNIQVYTVAFTGDKMVSYTNPSTGERERSRLTDLIPADVMIPSAVTMADLASALRIKFFGNGTRLDHLERVAKQCADSPATAFTVSIRSKTGDVDETIGSNRCGVGRLLDANIMEERGEDFANAPQTITELRAHRAESGSKWTPRDAVVWAARKIDAGEVTPVAAIVLLVEENEDGRRNLTVSQSAQNHNEVAGILFEALSDTVS